MTYLISNYTFSFAILSPVSENVTVKGDEGEFDLRWVEYSR